MHTNNSVTMNNKLVKYYNSAKDYVIDLIDTLKRTLTVIFDDNYQNI